MPDGCTINTELYTYTYFACVRGPHENPRNDEQAPGCEAFPLAFLLRKLCLIFPRVCGRARKLCDVKKEFFTVFNSDQYHNL